MASGEIPQGSRPYLTVQQVERKHKPCLQSLNLHNITFHSLNLFPLTLNFLNFSFLFTFNKGTLFIASKRHLHRYGKLFHNQLIDAQHFCKISLMSS
ncbi:unnamed protein product [Trifolium pratense]|uniref:Uncharacterized protein n=1 Tax=Trifolium pratense TaxID=57577 RepID=A0ACB0M0S1_TRIPR|nr:unnamed protein product [Trifolium pratense]